MYLRRYAAKNMALNLNRTFVLPYTTEDSSEKPRSPRTTRWPIRLWCAKNCQTRLACPLSRSRHPAGATRHRPTVPSARPGRKTLVYALRHAYQIASNPKGLPAMGVVLDVLDQDALAFYQSFEFFLPLTDNPMKLFVPMASLETL